VLQKAAWNDGSGAEGRLPVPRGALVEQIAVYACLLRPAPGLLCAAWKQRHASIG
jgi:hypothetical protein